MELSKKLCVEIFSHYPEAGQILYVRYSKGKWLAEEVDPEKVIKHDC